MARASSAACSAVSTKGTRRGGESDIEILLDQCNISYRWTGNRVDWGTGNGLQLPKQCGNIIGRVLTIEQKPINPGTRADFRTVGIGKCLPQTDLQTPFRNGLLEGIDRKFHARTGCALAPQGHFSGPLVVRFSVCCPAYLVCAYDGFRELVTGKPLPAGFDQYVVFYDSARRRLTIATTRSTNISSGTPTTRQSNTS